MISTCEKTSHPILLRRLRAYLNHYYDLRKREAAYAEKRFYSLEVELTNRCNKECIYCYNCSGNGSAHRDMPLELAMKIVRDAGKYGIKSISWLGGEPTLYPYLREVLEAASNFGIENVLFTNGSALTSHLWKDIAPYINKISFHLDSVDKDVFFALNNISPQESNRLFASTLKGMDTILASGFNPENISLYVVLLRETVEHLETLLDWALTQKGLGSTTLFPLVRTGKGRRLPSSQVLTIDELRSAYELRAMKENREELLLLGPSEYCKQYQLTMCYIDVKGNVVPYAGINEPMSQIADNDLVSVLRNHYACLSMAALFPKGEASRIHGACGNCINNALCFGTRTTAFNSFHDISASDPCCWWNDRYEN